LVPVQIALALASASPAPAPSAGCFFILAIGALAGSPPAGANLAAGETRLPSGVVVRIDDAASTAEEFKQKLKEKFGRRRARNSPLSVD
jgi:hypothetical protein